MGRIRELLAHGGLAVLAVVFALAFAAFNVATALAQMAVLVFNQHAGSEDFDLLEVRVFGTTLYLDALVQGVVTLLLVTVSLYVVFRLTRRSSVTCPECRSDIPRDATVCRYCTAEVRVPQRS